MNPLVFLALGAIAYYIADKLDGKRQNNAVKGESNDERHSKVQRYRPVRGTTDRESSNGDRVDGSGRLADSERERERERERNLNLNTSPVPKIERESETEIGTEKETENAVFRNDSEESIGVNGYQSGDDHNC